MTTQQPNGAALRVVVLGGGYAGMIATNRFLGRLNNEERCRVEVTVVNHRAEFVERIRLHELAAGSRKSVTRPLAQVLHPHANIVVGTATSIDRAERSVRLATADGQRELVYDYLVYAVGSRAAVAIPGAKEHAFLLADYDGAFGAARAIAHRGHRPKIAVIGGGFTGVEAASELAEQHPLAEVTLFCAGKVAPAMRSQARQRIAKILRRFGVRLVENARVVEVAPGKVLLDNGELHEFDVCLVAASFDVPDLAAVSGLPVDAAGRLMVDDTLRCVDDSRVVGAGDAIVAPESVAGHLRMGCAAALPLGGHAAQTLIASMRGTRAPRLSMGYIVQCVSLGRTNGYIQLVHADDAPRAMHVGGRTGARIKEMICSMVVDRPMKESTKPGAYSWPKGPKPGAAA